MRKTPIDLQGCSDAANGVWVPGLAKSMLERAKNYDIAGMDRILAICFWGRSGSFLLASYLDGHPDVIVLPELTSEAIFVFFEEHTGLSIWQKLVAYPEYSAARNGADGSLFGSDCAIEASLYYAAVHALEELHGGKPSTWLNARANFFRLIYVAYAVARGDRGVGSRPLMVHAQHAWNDRMAACLVADFPAAHFVHTVREPISALDSWFDRVLQLRTQHCDPSAPGTPLMTPAVDAMTDILSWDRPHREMEERTRAIRFEDLHLSPAATMRRLAEWLDIPYRECLTQSTWNGKAWIVSIRGVRCCGANPENARRRSKYLNPFDRLLIDALLYENFVAWNYTVPSIVRTRFVRGCILGLLLPLPMKIEWAALCWVMTYQVIPKLRHGRWFFALKAPAFFMKRRWHMMALITAHARARMAHRPCLLKVLEPSSANY